MCLFRSVASHLVLRRYSGSSKVSVSGRLLILRLSHQNTGAVGSLRRISNYRNSMEPVIECKLGRLRGKISESCLGGQYYSFQGIPYAKAPVGNLRFKAPQELDPWSGVLDATKEGPPCPSTHLMFFNFIGKEDNCLNLNVYTKEMPKDSDPPKPVMVFIHGGAFIQGSNSKEFYNPSYLMTQSVIQVIINYRLGVLGFLCLDDDSLGVMGNAGLKDQVMALKWVKENISSFGGDPNNVTIYGESAGSASVHYHLLSPASKGLFHKAILQSGCALNPWASGQRGTASLTKYLDIKDTEDKKILEKLQKMCLKKIVSAQMRVPEFFQGNVQRPYGPVIEHPSDEAFLVESPLKILKDGTYNQVPVIVGLNSNEGMLFEFVRVLHKLKGPIDCEMEIPFDMGLASKTEVTSLIGEKIKKFYKLDEGSDEDKLEAVHKLKADLQFVHGIHRFVNLQLLTNENPIYYYMFSFEGELNYFKKLATSKSTIPYFFMHYLINKTGMKGVFRKLGNSFGFRNIPGVCHADDLGYLFATFFTPSVSQNSREEMMIKRLVGLWTNFAKFGNPTPPNDDNLSVTWTPAEKENLNFLNIADELKMESYPFKERNVFWDNIYKEYSKN